MEPELPARPGDVLKTEYLERLGLSADELADAIGMPPGRMNEILVGRRAIREHELTASGSTQSKPMMWSRW